MSAESSNNDSPSSQSNDTLPFEMGGDARVVNDLAAAAVSKPVDFPTIGHIGRYVLKFKVGQGGLGTVFAAHDPLLSRLIAIKTVTPRVGNEERESFNTHFLNEARAAAGLSHPNIVTVFDAGVSPQGAYIAMELLKGSDLRQMRADGSKPTPVQAALIVRRVADALAYAHAKGVVHCDIKPANIFMVSPTQPKVLDFGIARIMHPTTGEAGKLIGGGSPRYMAPEQLQGGETDRRSDVFSLGVVLYELLTDSSPFARPTLEAITQAVMEHEPPSVDQVDASIPPALGTIVARAMHKSPAQRYQSARVFARELRRWVDGQLEGSEGRDTGTDPVGLTRPGGLGAFASSGQVGVNTRPSGSQSPTQRDREKGRDRERSKSGHRDSVASAIAAAILPEAVKGGSHRGWTITGLASVAVLTAASVLWLGDSGMGRKPPTQEIASAPLRAGVASGNASAAPPAFPASVIAAPSASAAVRAPAVAITSDAAAVPDAPGTRADWSRDAASTLMSPGIEAGLAAADPGTAPPGPAAMADPGPPFNDDASSASSDIPTVRLSPRIRENPIATDRPGTRRRPPLPSASPSLSRDGAVVASVKESTPIDSPGFSRRDERMAPVSTAVLTRLGFVDVHANPAAEIEIDGSPGGSATPDARLRMTEGIHTITLRRDGFQPRRMRVRVTEGRPVAVAYDFGK